MSNSVSDGRDASLLRQRSADRDVRDDAAAAFMERCTAQLRVALQPLYALESGALYGYEALARGWREMGYDTAHQLFDEAQELGVLADLEAHQIEQAIAALRRNDGRDRPVLFVNLDSRLLDTPSRVLERATRALIDHGFDQRRLCIELSERHEKTASVAIEQNIKRIRADGFQIGLDDFGAGVSDIKALYKYDLHFLKIDGFFVQGIANDHRKRFFVASMVELAHMLGQKVVVEGIETQEDLAICRQLCCDIGQGYCLARPLENPSSAPQVIEFEDGACDASGVDHAESLECYIDFLPALPHKMPMGDVMKLFSLPEAPAVLPVVGDKNEPIGLLRESSLRRLVHSPFGRELLQNRNSGIKLAQYVASCPMVDVGVDVGRLAELFAHDGVEGVIVTSEMRYIGFLPASKLLQLNAARQLRAAREANPLTHLGGNGVVSNFIKSMANERASDRIFCYFDFDNFKPFNDHYGFALGDRAILLFSSLLKQAFDGENFVLGHIGGDDFFAGSCCISVGEMRSRLNDLLARFRHEVESLYAPEDRAAGGIHGHDREGNARLFPLLDCSVGVLHAPEGWSYNSDVIGGAVSALKCEAKATSEHIAYIRLGAQPKTEAGFGTSEPSEERARPQPDA